MKKLLSLALVMSLVTTLFVGLAGAAPAEVSGKEVIPNEVQRWEVKDLTEEEYIKRSAQITGKSEHQIGNEINQATAQDFVYREYQLYIGLGSNNTAVAGVLAKLERLQMGASTQYRFEEVLNDTAYLSPYSGRSFTVIKNYATGQKDSDTQITLLVSGYAETAVVNDHSSGSDLTVGELISLGWNYSPAVSSTEYYRLHFSAQQRFYAN